MYEDILTDENKGELWRTTSTTFPQPVNEEIDISSLLIRPVCTLLIFLSSLRKRVCMFLCQRTYTQVWPRSSIFLPSSNSTVLVESDSIPLSLFVIADLDSPGELELAKEALGLIVRGSMISVVFQPCLCLSLTYVGAWLKNPYFVHPQS